MSCIRNTYCGGDDIAERFISIITIRSFAVHKYGVIYIQGEKTGEDQQGVYALVYEHGCLVCIVCFSLCYCHVAQFLGNDIGGWMVLFWRIFPASGYAFS